MNRLVDRRPHFAKHALPTLLGTALLLCTCAFGAPGARAASTDKSALARDQFATAVRMRTMLEGYLGKDRSVSDYKQTIDAYQKVYDISTEAEEVPASLIAEAELYEEMGRLYDGKYYDSAITTYFTLLNQYPSRRYRSAALFAIAEIQQNDQNKPEAAQSTYRDFLKKYPNSERAQDARKALKDIAAALTPKQPAITVAVASQSPTSAPAAASLRDATPQPGTILNASDDPAVAGTVVQPREADRGLSVVKGLQTTNDKDGARIIIALNDTVDFQSARIASPDRIYFNISRATLGPKAAGKDYNDDRLLLRSVRVAQNKPDVVRIVLDAPSAKDFSAYLLSKPYRLVIEVRSHANSGPQRTAYAANMPPAQAASSQAAADANAAPASTPTLTQGPLQGPMQGSGQRPLRAKETPVSLNRRADIPPDIPRGGPLAAPRPTTDGDTSLTRALGLKIHRIVIDAGHGGHDTGTVGPHGLMEKDLCLDVALRLGKEIEQKLPGAEVVYTRQDDTFIPLEERTRIANDAKADLFISIHANSSHDDTARGVETYYLNFSTSDESMEVAARENAASQESLHDLQDLIKKIARNDKIEESKEFAGDVQDSLAHKLAAASPSVHNRGVKQAPFVVLIGADMPSILAEISFVSNPTDERLLKNTPQRQKIADGLFRGITNYLDSLNSLSTNKQKPADTIVADNRLEARNASASPGGSVSAK